LRLLHKADLSRVSSRKSSVTLERLEDYKELIETATNDLEARLENIDEKLGTLMARTATSAETTELQSIKDERSSTQKCLLICAQLSELIEQLRPTTTGGTSRDGDGIPEKITSDGIKKCRTSMEETTARLEKHMQDILDRMMSKSMTTMAQDDAKYFARLREDWTTARQCRDILSEADHRLKENISVIDNHATGDETVQLLVSNSQKTIHGKNRGYGFQIKQLGGHLSDESIQKVSGDFLQMSLRRSGSTGQPGSSDALFEGPEENERRPNWQPQYGNGRKLQS
jgi:vacuolar-type H+-ATPase subunit E/Vma4